MNFTAKKPIYLQIADLVEDNILRGEWVEGDRIASVRDLGVSLAVNPATVLRAYDELSELDLIEQRRGVGYSVVEGAVQKAREIRRKEFVEKTLPEIFVTMDNLGITQEEVKALYNNRNVR